MLTLNGGFLHNLSTFLLRFALIVFITRRANRFTGYNKEKIDYIYFFRYFVPDLIQISGTNLVVFVYKFWELQVPKRCIHFFFSYKKLIYIIFQRKYFSIVQNCEERIQASILKYKLSGGSRLRPRNIANEQVLHYCIHTNQVTVQLFIDTEQKMKDFSFRYFFQSFLY